MFARGPMPGGTPKADAMRYLPKGTRCYRASAMGITGYIVELPDGRKIASGSTATDAWGWAELWGKRHQKELK